MIMTIASMVSGVANVMGEQSAIKKQDAAYAEWLKNQRESRIKQSAAEDKARALATAAQQKATADISGTSQQKAVDTETNRLTGALTSNVPGNISQAPTAVSDASIAGGGAPAEKIVGGDSHITRSLNTTAAAAPSLTGTATPMAGAMASADPLLTDTRVLSGQVTGDMDPTFRASLVTALNRSAGDARDRLAALARVTSYGGSQFGLNNYVADALQRSGTIIDQMNARRAGIIQVGEKERAIDPLHYTYTPGISFS